jgi:fido (protein-threonine AMPylation protein)
MGQLLDETDELAELLAGAEPDDGYVAAARDRAAVASLRLDGSPIEQVPPRVEDLPIGTTTGPARGGWLEVLRAGAGDLERAPDEVVLAIEHHGVRAGLDADGLGLGLVHRPLASLRDLHRRLTEGLLAPAVAGATRRTGQAVHDASIGRVLFFPADPSHLPERLERLATWLADDQQRHPVVTSGVLHHQVLDLHPFEAANGRLARTAARLVLADAGIDADRVGQPEEAVLDDAIGYLDDIARSRRLGDPGVFVARWAEAVVEGLRRAAADLDVLPDVEVPHTTVRFLADRAGGDFTVRDHREAGGDDHDLDAARRAGLATRLLGTRGLRWRAPSAD